VTDEVVIPDYTDAIVAVRAFREPPSKDRSDAPIYLRGGRSPAGAPRAWSFGHTTAWQPETNTATCNNGGEHPVPDESCSCGFYALSDASDLNSTYSHHLYDHAVVKLWGRVIPGSRGWRAEYAAISAFLLTRGAERRRLRKLARAYGVPLLRSVPELTPPMMTVDADMGVISTMVIGQYRTVITPSQFWGNVAVTLTDGTEDK